MLYQNEAVLNSLKGLMPGRSGNMPEDEWVIPFYPIKENIAEIDSSYQNIKLVRLKNGKRALFLDGDIQFVEVDEFKYHEELAIVPLFYHPKPQNVLIIGGGDGLAAREVLKDSRVKHLSMMELDSDVIRMAKEYLDDLNEGALKNDKLEILIGDCRENMKAARCKYDVALIDLVDFDSAGAEVLYKEVIDLLPPILNPRAVVNLMAAETICLTQNGQYKVPFTVKACTMLMEKFPYCHIHTASMESYAEDVGFVFASGYDYVGSVSLDAIRENALGFVDKLSYLSPEMFPGRLAMPPYLAKFLVKK